MTKWACNESNFEQSINNVAILPAVTQAIILHYFPHQQEFELDGIYDDDDDIGANSISDSDIVNNNKSNQSNNLIHSKKLEQERKMAEEIDIVESIKWILSKNITISK